MGATWRMGEVAIAWTGSRRRQQVTACLRAAMLILLALLSCAGCTPRNARAGWSQLEAEPLAEAAAKADGPRKAIEAASADVPPFTMLGAYGGFVGAAEGSGGLLLIGLGNRVATLVLNEAGQPRLLGESELLGGNVTALSVEGNRVAAALGPGGLAILDISEPARPRLLGSLFVGGEVRCLALQGNRVLLVDDDFGLYIVSLDDVRSPSFIGPGLPLLRGTESLVVAGNRIYLGGASGIAVVDITKPEEPAVVATLEAAYNVRSLVLSGNTLIAARGNEEISVSDISDASGIREFAHFNLPAPSYFAADLALDGTRLLVAAQEGLWLLDMSKPRSPVFLNQPTSAGAGRHVRLATFVDQQPVSVQGSGRILVHSKDNASDIAAMEPPFMDAMGELATDGHWLALSGEFDRSVTVFDLADPTRPQLMGRIDRAPVENGILIVHEHLILVSWEGADKRLQVYSLRESPFRLEHDEALPASFHELGLAPFGFTLSDGSGVTLMGLSAASTPSLLGRVPVEGGARRAQVFDQQMVVLNASGAWIHKIDISDPAAARQIEIRGGSVDYLIDVDTGATILNGNTIWRIDLWSTFEPTITASTPLPEIAPAFTLYQRRLYAYGPRRLVVFDFDEAGGIRPLADMVHQGLIRRLRVSGELLVAGGFQLTIWRGQLSPLPTPEEPATATPRAGSAEPPQPTLTPSPVPTSTLLVHLELQSELAADGGYSRVESDGDTVVGLRADGGMHRIDFSDPKRPVPGPTVTLPGPAYGIALAKGLAYVLAGPAPGESWGGFHVYRIPEAGAPERLGSTDFSIQGEAQPALAVRGTWVLVLAGNTLFSVDVRNPARPERVGIELDHEWSDAFGGSMLRLEGDVAHLLTRGSYLQMNIKSPPNPKQLRIPYLELPGGFMHVHRGYLAFFSYSNAVVDVRREGEPRLVSSTQTSLPARYQLGSKAGDLLLVGPSGGPLLAYDFSRPPALVPVALSHAPMGFTSLAMAKDLLLVARPGQGLAAYRLRYPRFLPRVSRGAAPRGR